jgi:hypothetical protein
MASRDRKSDRAGGQHADRGRAHGERRQRGGDHARLVRIRQRQELLELIHEQQQAARRSVGCPGSGLLGAGRRSFAADEVLPDRAGDRIGAVAQRRGELGLAGAGPRGERRRERVHGMARRDHVDAGPAIARGEPRQDAGPTQRRLAGARVTADHDERLGPHAIDQLANLAPATKEQGTVDRFERGEAAVGIAVGEPGFGGWGGALLERDQQGIRGGEPGACISLDQAIDDRGQRRLDARGHVGDARGGAVLDDAGELGQRDTEIGRRADQELVEQDAERVEVRPAGGGLAAPDLGRHVQRRPHRVRPGIRPEGGDLATGDARPARDGAGIDPFPSVMDRRRGYGRISRRHRLAPQRGGLAGHGGAIATASEGTPARGRHGGLVGGRLGGRLGGPLVDDPGEPEVEELGAAFVGEDRVRRLDVAVKDPAAVRRGQPAREVERDVEDLSPRHRVVELIERTAVHVLGDQVGMSVNLGDSIDRDDVGAAGSADAWTNFTATGRSSSESCAR